MTVRAEHTVSGLLPAMTIGGAAVAAAETFDVVNPATGEVVGAAPVAGASVVDKAMAAAQAALSGWRDDAAARRGALHAAADAVEAAADQLVPVITAEQGKPLADSRREVGLSATWLRYFADLDMPVEVLRDSADGGVQVEVHRRPLGVVAAITPWNLPLCTAAWKIAPALTAGNTLVLKPSEFTPLTNLLLGEILRDVMPPGTVNIITGTGTTGALMCEHPTPRKVAFTGSVATGKRIAATAASDLKRVTLELGGNDPAIVLDDADVDAIAASLFTFAFSNNGQVCAAIKRVYAPENLYDRLVDALADRARTVKVGDGRDPNTDYGPLNNRPQLERVTELVDDALANGARAVAGGKARGGAGLFYEPTILADCTDGMRIVDEEQFGPVAPVIPYTRIEDAVTAANGTHFGLGASVWTGDPARGEAIAPLLDAGRTWINAHTVSTPAEPFGGLKWSGIGVENGPWGLEAYTDIQVRYSNRTGGAVPR